MVESPFLSVVTALMALTFLLSPTHGFGQTQNQAAVLRGEGVFLWGAGSYNLNTAKANSINVDTVIKWKRELRQIEAERRELIARKEAGKKLKIEDVKRQHEEREQQLRANPTPEDIVTGEALNVLLYDLTDPDITSTMWSLNVVDLPKGMSVKDMIFRFTPLSRSSDTSKALSRGVIALSLLDTTGDKWPTVMRQFELKSERQAYETAYARLREQLLSENLKLQTLDELDQSLEALKSRADKEITKNRGFRDEATKFVEDLKNATRFFDAKTVDYAKEILIDTKDNDATTVGELVGFMLKYRLQFANAERSATGRVLYGKLYEVMHQQAKLFGIKAVAAFPSIAGAWQDGNTRIQITQTGSKFKAVGKYPLKDFGEVTWVMNGTISKDGEFTGEFVHTKAPKGFGTQTRRGKFSEIEGKITGHAEWKGGGHPFEWKLVD